MHFLFVITTIFSLAIAQDSSQHQILPHIYQDITQASADLSSLSSTCPLHASPLLNPSSICPSLHHCSPEPNPWTHPQTCTVPTASANKTKFCIYTSSTFSSNRGISILTTPELISDFTSIAALTPSLPQSKSTTKNTPLAPNNKPPPFEIKHVSGKGLGVVANRTIQRGEIIFSNPVIGIFHNDAFLKPAASGYHEVRELFHKAIDQLPNSARELFWGLSSHEIEQETEEGVASVKGKVDEVMGRLNTNTFGEEFGDEEEYSLVVPETARLNHDCRPNAIYHLDSKTLIHDTHASTTIYAGEEITITYIDPLQTTSKRQNAISRSWGFKCTCPHCTQPPTLRQESDRRIRMILNLTSELEDFTTSWNAKITAAIAYNSTSSPGDQEPKFSGTGHSKILSEDEKEMVAKAEFLISLYKQEKLHAHIGEAYKLAALVCRKLGLEWEARKWAMLGAEALLVSEGVGNGEWKSLRRLSRGLKP